MEIVNCKTRILNSVNSDYKADSSESNEAKNVFAWTESLWIMGMRYEDHQRLRVVKKSDRMLLGSDQFPSLTFSLIRGGIGGGEKNLLQKEAKPRLRKNKP